MLQKFWNSIPQLSIAIIILAIIKMTLYYYNFDVPIKYFIGISELGLLIADDLLIYIPFLGVLYFLFVEPAGESKGDLDRKTDVPVSVTNVKTKPGRIRKFLDSVMLWIFGGIFVAIGIGIPI